MIFICGFWDADDIFLKIRRLECLIFNFRKKSKISSRDADDILMIFRHSECLKITFTKKSKISSRGNYTRQSKSIHLKTKKHQNALKK